MLVRTAASSILEGTASDLVLRISGSSRDGQVVRLRSDKCTIGSGPRCTLRLQARGVRPVHCLVLRGPQATVVRCWGPDTLLNGRRFSDEPLTPGDRLTVGPIELEMLTSDGQSRETADSQRSATLDAREAALDAQQRAIDLLRQQWEAERTEKEANLARRAEQLAAQQSEAAATRDGLDQQRQQWDAEQTDARQQILQQTQQLDARLADLERQSRTLAEERRQWETERAAREAELAERGRSVESRQAELDAIQQELRQERRQLRSEETETRPRTDPSSSGGADDYSNGKDHAAQRDVKFEEVAKGSPLSSLELLRKLGAVPTFLEEEDESSEPAQSAPPRASRSETHSQPPSRTGMGDDPSGADSQADASSAGEHEESVHQYMAGLLARLRGDAAEPKGRRASRTPEMSAAEPGPAASAPATPSDPAHAGAESPGHGKRREAVEMAPRTIAPEKSVDITLLREVANLSAKQAIGRHARRRLAGAVLGKLAVALVALIAGVGLIGYWWWFDSSDPLRLYAGGACLLVAILWGLYFPVVSARRILGGKKSSRGKRPED